MFDLKDFRKDISFSRVEMSRILKCTVKDVLKLEAGKCDLDEKQMRRLIRRFGADEVYRYMRVPLSAINSADNIISNGESVNYGKDNNIANKSDLSVIKKQQAIIAEMQKQMDRLLSIIETKLLK